MDNRVHFLDNSYLGDSMARIVTSRSDLSRKSGQEEFPATTGKVIENLLGMHI